ncbi:MAG: hypothetical protein JJO71_28925 [Escherichia coli]|nr:hypothetical protein [Escherichia coli]MBL1007660.1 hypothetical protein [Escherichia coli]
MTKTKMVVLSVEVEDISVKIQVATEDYSAVYDLQLFKQEYDKETKTWNTTDEATKRYEEYVNELGGLPNEDDVIELFLNEEKGKAYVTEPKGFTQIEKPLASLKRLKKVPIVEIKDSAKGRAVVVEHEGKHYAFNFNSGVYIEKLNKFIPNQAKLAKAKVRFNELFEDVNITWDNPELAIGLVVDCTVNKNALDPKSQYGWLEALPLDPEEQPNIGGDSDELPF